MMILICAIGMLWIYVCWERLMNNIKLKIAKEPNKIKKVKIIIDTIMNDPNGKDLRFSIICIVLGCIIFVGVTGMMVGLVTSLLVSVYIRAKQLLSPKPKK